MHYSEQLSIGDFVVLTPEGAKEHRQHHLTGAAVTTAAVAAVAAPVAIGAGIGIAAAGSAIGVSTGAAGGLAGGLAGAAASSVLGGSPEGGQQGQIFKKERRWWGQSGFDYEVEWEDGSTSWHLGKHLRKTDH